MNFGMIILKQNIKTMLLFVICYRDTGTFIIHTKTEDFYEDNADDVKNRYDTSNYEVVRPLPKRMNVNVIGLIKDELGGTIRTEFVSLRPKTYSYLTDDDKNIKKPKRTKKCVIKRIIKFDDYKNCLFKNKVILKSQQRFKSNHIVYILNKSIRLHQEVNKMMIKDYKLLIESKHIHMEDMFLKYVKVRCK